MVSLGEFTGARLRGPAGLARAVIGRLDPIGLTDAAVRVGARSLTGALPRTAAGKVRRRELESRQP